MTVRLASAPISYGVFAATTAGAEPAELLRSVAEAGYEGCELGPPGFFGDPASTANAFASAGLAAVGAYVPLHLAGDDATMEADLAGMALSCAELAACGGGLAILADEGSPDLLAHPARAWDDRTWALDDDQWSILARRLTDAMSRARDMGATPSFHPHISTFVESPWEVERLLELTEVSLTLDIGHITLAGGDPVHCLRAWADRINHVHIKDVRIDVLQQARNAGRTDFDEWWADVCTPLGHGDVDVTSFVTDLIATGYDDWLVVEQDRRPTALEEYAAVAAEQAANRRWLAGAVRGVR